MQLPAENPGKPQTTSDENDQLKIRKVISLEPMTLKSPKERSPLVGNDVLVRKDPIGTMKQTRPFWLAPHYI